MKIVRFYTDETGAHVDDIKLEPWHIQITNRNGETTLCGVPLDGSNNYSWHVKDVKRTRSAVCPMCLDLSYYCRTVKAHCQDNQGIKNKHGNAGRKRSPETVAKTRETNKRRGTNRNTARPDMGRIYDGKDGAQVYRKVKGN